MQVAEAQARLEHNKRYIAFLQHQIDLKEARAASQKAQEDEVTLSHLSAVFRVSQHEHSMHKEPFSRAVPGSAVIAS